MTEIVAHLNGGPKDDETFVVPFPALWIERPVLPLRPFDVSQPDAIIASQRGKYEPRYIPDTTIMVPHALDGSVEFDWAGWQ